MEKVVVAAFSICVYMAVDGMEKELCVPLPFSIWFV
jgi:hypothetical protein